MTKFSEGQMIKIPDIETPLPDLPVEVRHDLGGADVLLLHQLAHLKFILLSEVLIVPILVEPVFWRAV